MKILIVDDSKAMQQIVKRGLEKLGYDDLEIVLASNAQDALVISKNWKPKLILSDWHMPEMTGIELMHELGKSMLDIDVGFVTTESSPERIKEAKDAGALFVVNKPFDVKTLHDAVLPALQRTGVKDAELEIVEGESAHAEGEKMLILPKSESLQKAFKMLSVKEILVSDMEAAQPKQEWLPCVIGLFGFNNEKNIKVVVVFDLIASTILGSSFVNVDNTIIDTAVNDKVIPKSIIDGCERALYMISLIIGREGDNRDLSMISMSTVTSNIDKLGKLIGRKEVKRIDYDVSNNDYKNGRVIILCP
jgi:CheY-like chemotaxis protein